jgi:hypothetical protein
VVTARVFPFHHVALEETGGEREIEFALSRVQAPDGMPSDQDLFSRYVAVSALLLQCGTGNEG